MSILYTVLVYPIELILSLVFTMANQILGNPALAIVLVSLTVNVLVLPLYKKSDAMQDAERSKQASMAHWVEHIKKTFRGDERFMMLSAYYRQQNYKPIYALRGSLSLLLQIPFFIAAYHFLSNLEALSGAQFLMIPDLAQPDGLLHIGTRNINVLPLLMTGINMISGAVYTRGFSRKEKLQLYGTALVFLVLLYKSPSGLVFYWTLNNLFSLGKNIFTKLVPQPEKVIAVLLSLSSLAVCPWLMLHYGNSRSRILLFVLIFAVLQIPLILHFLHKKGTAGILAKIEPSNELFLLNTLILTGLLGLLVSSAVIGSEPEDFLRVGPMKLIGNNVCIFAGFFLVWLNVFYFLSDKKGKSVLSVISFGASLVCLADYMTYTKQFGIMTSFFTFEVLPIFSLTEKLGSLAVCGALLAAACFIVMKAPDFGKNVCRVLLVGILALSAVNCRHIHQVVKKFELEDSSALANDTAALEQENKLVDKNLLHFSRNGKNVIVLMLDRAISGYTPYLFEERPELKDAFEGFTFYPNTVSFGSFTIFGTPALFGGYEYTPVEMNRRDTEPLSEKHDEALLLMPTLFSENGYRVTVVDPPCAGYESPTDLSIYDDLENVNAIRYTGTFSSSYELDFTSAFEELQEYNLFGYCVLRTLPVPARGVWYQEGKYGADFSFEGSFSCNEQFLNFYSALPYLPQLTVVDEDDSGTLLLMDNEATHYPTFLDVPSYEPSMNLKEDDRAPMTKTAEGYEDLRLETESQISSYQVSMAAFLKVADWFNMLKKLGVYDNTRIIVVSDHGSQVIEQFKDLVFNDGELPVECYQALMMVKDFNSRELGVSDEFMTVADVPTLATEGVIDQPINPYTGNMIESAEKKAVPQIITTSINWEIETHNENTFNLDDGEWYSVHDNIFLEDNWAKIDR